MIERPALSRFGHFFSNISWKNRSPEEKEKRVILRIDLTCCFRE